MDRELDSILEYKGITFKEIKNNMEERNIKLSLEKAREFYSKGVELKDLALSAFTEDEILISKLPKTWEEFCNNYNINCDKDSYITDCSDIKNYPASIKKRAINTDRNLLPSREAAEQHLVLMQLHQLRDCYRQGWIPDWDNKETIKYGVECVGGRWIVLTNSSTRRFLTFQTEELAEEFLNNFRDLIIQAGDLI